MDNIKINDDMVSYPSKINPEFTVYVLYNTHESYKIIKESLQSMNNSIGALWVGTKNIFLDGEAIADLNIDHDHLLALEAHEIAHSILGHEPGVNAQSETEADLLAIAILTEFNYERAAGYIKDRLEKNTGISYDVEDSEI